MANSAGFFRFTGKRGLKSRDALYGYLFISPQMLGYFLFVLGPLIAVMFYSAQDRNLLTGEITFVGLGNYREMFFQDPIFWKVLRNTLIFAAGLVPLNVSLALLLALLISRKIRGIIFFRTIFFSPVVTSAVAWAIVWSFMLQGEQGPINQYLAMIGIDGPNWLREPGWAMFSVIVTRALKGVGINMIIFLSTIINLPPEYYDAATVDGANTWQSFRHITFPLLAPTTLLVTILTLIGSFKVFDTIFMMTGGGPANATLVLVYYVYYQGFQFFETGYASGLSVILFAITFGLVVLQWISRRKFVYHEQ